MKSNKKTMIFIGTAALLCLTVAVIIIWMRDSDGRRLNHQMQLGRKYLEEMDYEQAVVAFNAVIKIDPANEDAYLGMADAYIRMGEYENSLDCLDILLEWNGENERALSALDDCLGEYLNILLADESYDDIRKLAEKYEDMTVNTDFQSILEGAGDQGNNVEEGTNGIREQGNAALPERITQTETKSYYNRGAKTGERIITIEFEAGSEWTEAMLVTNTLSKSLTDRIVVPAGYHPVMAWGYDDGELISTYEWDYDDSGYCIQEIYNYLANTWSSRNFEDVTTFTNDTAGNPVSWISSHKETDEGENIRRGGYRYDENGNLVEITLEGQEDNPLYAGETFTYSSDGQIELYNDSGFNSFYEYDEQGRVAKETLPSIGYYKLYSYDENNYLTERSCYNQYGTLINQSVFEYE